MKFIGFNRVKGEKNGNAYDFVQLVIEKENLPVTGDKGGSQILMQRTSKGYSLPSINTDNFVKALKSGVSIGSEVKLYRDFENNIIFEKA